jgi:hypothetical protein
MKKIFIQLSLVMVCTYALQSCAPVFSELQSARTVGKNNFEVTPSGSITNFKVDGEGERVQNNLGIQMAYGVTPRFDVRLRYERLWIPGEDNFKDGFNVIGLAPKYSLLKDRIAFSLLLGKGIGDELRDTWEIHPTMLFSLPLLEDKIDFNFSPKYLIRLAEENSNFMALNTGLSVSGDLKKWSFKPEFGILFSPGDSGFYSHLSLGFSYTFGNN